MGKCLQVILKQLRSPHPKAVALHFRATLAHFAASSAQHVPGLQHVESVAHGNTRRCLNTMFGHVSGVVSMDLHHKGRPATGGADKTVRVWKVDRETHLVFNRHTASADAVTVVDQDTRDRPARYISEPLRGAILGHLCWSSIGRSPGPKSERSHPEHSTEIGVQGSGSDEIW